MGASREFPRRVGAPACGMAVLAARLCFPPTKSLAALLPFPPLVCSLHLELFGIYEHLGLVYLEEVLEFQRSIHKPRLVPFLRGQSGPGERIEKSGCSPSSSQPHSPLGCVISSLTRKKGSQVEGGRFISSSRAVMFITQGKNSWWPAAGTGERAVPASSGHRCLHGAPWHTGP